MKTKLQLLLLTIGLVLSLSVISEPNVKFNVEEFNAAGTWKPNESQKKTLNEMLESLKSTYVEKELINEFCTLKGEMKEMDVLNGSVTDMLRGKLVAPYSKIIHLKIKFNSYDGEVNGYPGTCSAEVNNFPDTLDSFSIDTDPLFRVECIKTDNIYKIRNYSDGRLARHDIIISVDGNTGIVDAKSTKLIKTTGYNKEIQASGICPGLIKNSSSKRSVTNTDPSTLNKTPKKSKGYSSGTGFYVNKKGVMITNNHVVKNCSKIKVDGSNAVVKSFDTTNDLALLQVESLPASVPDFRSGRGIRLGDGVTVAGYPLRSVLGSGLNVVTGTVASLSGIKNNSSRLQITAPINSGNSGGPLFDSSGRVVGVIVSKINNTKAKEILGEEIQGANFAIKGSIVRSFLDMNDVDYEVSTSNKNMSTADIAENAKEYTALIKCWK